MNACSPSRERDPRPALEIVGYDFAHKLNNALTPILAYSELLLRQPANQTEPSTLLHHLERIRSAAEDAAQAVRQMRDFCVSCQSQEASALQLLTFQSPLPATPLLAGGASSR